MRSLLFISALTLMLLLAGQGARANGINCGQFSGCSACTADGCWWCDYDQTCLPDSQQGNCERGCPASTAPSPSTTAAPATCPFPSSSRASHQWDANQVVGGDVSPYTWWISPCGGTVPTLNGGCSGAAQGYLAEYSNDIGCVNEWDTITEQWVKHRSGFFDAYTATFTGSAASGKAKVTIVCNGQVDTIQHVGDVDVITTNSGDTTYVFNLKTSPAGCQKVTSSPAPTPRPTAPNNCNSHQSCAGCTQASSGLCGWCVQTKTCSQGTSTGPSAPATCPAGDWRWYFSSC